MKAEAKPIEKWKEVLKGAEWTDQTIYPPHEVRDKSKFNRIVNYIIKNKGWGDMPPIVVAGDNEALTGSHRLAAVQHIREEHPTLYPKIPYVEFPDEIFKTYNWEEIAGMGDDDIADMLIKEGYPEIAILFEDI